MVQHGECATAGITPPTLAPLHVLHYYNILTPASQHHARTCMQHVGSWFGCWGGGGGGGGGGRRVGWVMGPDMIDRQTKRQTDRLLE